MSSVLLINNTSEGVPLLLKLTQEGSIGKVYSTELTESLKGYKNPTRIMTLSMIEQFDLIVACGCVKETAQITESAITKGLPIFGGGAFSLALERDKAYHDEVVNTILKQTPCQNQDGVPLVICSWYTPQEGITLPFYAYNYKRMMEGNRGAWMESQGAVVWQARPDDELVSALLKPLEPLLNKAKYRGMISIYFTMSDKALYVGKIKVRFDFDIIQAYFELLKSSLFNFLWQLKEGRSAELPLLDQYGISVRVSIPPYPYPADWDAHLFRDKRLVVLPEGARKHFCLSDVKLNNEGYEVLAGVNGNIGCATARGEDIHEARSRVYRTLNNTISLPDIQFRGDIGPEVEMKIDQGKTWGWMNA